MKRNDNYLVILYTYLSLSLVSHTVSPLSPSCDSRDYWLSKRHTVASYAHIHCDYCTIRCSDPLMSLHMNNLDHNVESMIQSTDRIISWERQSLELDSNTVPSQETSSVNDYDKIMIEGVIFDVDGTLLDTEMLSTKAMENILHTHDSSLSIHWELKSKIVGMRGVEWSRIVIQELNLQDIFSPEDFVVRWESELNTMAHQVRAMPGAQTLVRTFYE